VRRGWKFLPSFQERTETWRDERGSEMEGKGGQTMFFRDALKALAHIWHNRKCTFYQRDVGLEKMVFQNNSFLLF
jgi:hypothetical protein